MSNFIKGKFAPNVMWIFILVTWWIHEGAEVPEVSWCEPGEDAALEALMGKATGFVNMYFVLLPFS
jgi:hypothetical protein